ncbi:hypothetical protein GMB86_00380 [Terrilactibacillus sp. BCM23-1]|uniref:UPF0342 protein GMB86_00380 n=1 Tax=Terrilactibacillus tamarindi TaxID=2599694 RepID=A0A6N8CKY2_9BACI|nr:YlbF family regulator [Terrilactibacillus tamarindi]MTT30469.1 hypothetical protein [Terrilactibacillus tamarindi]
MATTYDIAYDLEKQIRESDEYEQLKQAYQTVNEHDEAKKLFDEFRQLQLDLQQKQMSGEAISEEEAKNAETSFQNIQQHKEITDLMSAEQRMSLLINDLNQIITKPLQELYGTLGEENK